MSTGVCGSGPDTLFLAWDAKNLEALFTVRPGRLVSFTTVRASQSANCMWLLLF